ncbi:VCBS repeat-containing protein [Streptomyces sp. NBC_01318]|uniref:FG-GAP repeat protein n=1 Tax=Streptomyces sp. NBC_01318 TaxID=2903823 RepID=UPI002E0F4D81|nr:VCBS repeat-containing protein [Streptomyces sp. NBC_01318]
MSLQLRTVVAIAAAAALTGGLLTAVTAAPAVAAPAKYADDFNGDGHRDLAIGMPYKTINGASAAGGVIVTFGSATGLTTKRVGLNQSSSGVPGTPEDGDRFGISIAGGDLDADGYADLVVGADHEGVGSNEGQGSVTILWGGTKPFTSSTTTTVADPHPWQAHGWDVAVGDFTGDSGADLAVIESESVAVYAGGFARGSQPKPTYTGLTGPGGQLGNSEAAVGDIDGDGKDDLAVTGGDSGYDRPAVDVFYGAAGRPRTGPRVTGGGTAVALGDINGDGYDDMAASLTWPEYYSAADPSAGAGYVTVRYGSASGVGDPVVIHQNSAGVPGADEDADGFGSSLAIGDITADGRAELVVGVNGEDLGSTKNAGDVAVFRGSASGVSMSGVVRISQGTTGVPGGPETDDLFGGQVRLADYNHNGKADLAVTAPFENGRNGALWTLLGTASGLTGSGSKVFGSDDYGLANGSRLGESLLD